MDRRILFGAAIVFMLAALMVLSTGCFGGTNAQPTATSEAVKPKPSVVKTVATTSGTEAAYFVTLEITVKNDGAEGTILVQASVTQAGKTGQNSMPVYLKEGQSHELKLTFPLTWQGGDWTSNVQTIIP